MLAELLTKEGFAMWINQLDNEEYAGISGNSIKCPLCNYLNSIQKHPNNAKASVGVTTLILADNNADLEWMPKWATAFVLQLDLQHRGERVNAAICKNVLSMITV